MTTKFQCDGCQTVLNPDQKEATFELTQREAKTLPHLYFHAKLELCKTCFEKARGMFMRIMPKLNA